MMYRNVEKLKELRTSRFRSRIRARSVAQEERDIVPIPGWTSGPRKQNQSFDLASLGSNGSAAGGDDEDVIQAR
jgi:hypothetical protein